MHVNPAIVFPSEPTSLNTVRVHQPIHKYEEEDTDPLNRTMLVQQLTKQESTDSLTPITRPPTYPAPIPSPRTPRMDHMGPQPSPASATSSPSPALATSSPSPKDEITVHGISANTNVPTSDTASENGPDKSSITSSSDSGKSESTG